MINGAATATEAGKKMQMSNFTGTDSVTFYMQNPDVVLNASSRINYDNALLQEIVEEGYADLQARLKAVGRELVLIDTMSNSEGYKTLKFAEKDIHGDYLSTDNNGGLATINYSTYKPNSMPLWFIMVNPLDQGGTASKVSDALTMKNVGSLKQLTVDSDAMALDMTFRIRPAFVYALREKMLRSAEVGIDPYLAVMPGPVIMQTYQKTYVGILPKSMGELRVDPLKNNFKDDEQYPFNYGYDYATFKKDNSTVDTSFFTKTYTKSTIVDIDPDREKFKTAVLNALKVTNATIALWARENPAK